MAKRFLLSIVVTLMSLCAKAQSEFYVVMKDGSAERFSADKVDSMTFRNPEVGAIMGFSDMMKMIDELKSKVDSLEAVASNCCKCSDTTPNLNHAYVDLGLKSGTLWATCNVGATKPEEYGDYFAWGETKPKESYEEDCKWCKVSCDSLLAWNVIDKDSVLTVKHDAATVNWGADWRLPTRDEIKELVSIENEYAEVNGVAGRKFIGTNGNTLFLPFSSNIIFEDFSYEGIEGDYWSAVADDGDIWAYGMSVGIKGSEWNILSRPMMCSVRPVRRTK